jgi:hypothetical protein
VTPTPFPPGWDSIASTEPYTYGAAFQRVREAHHHLRRHAAYPKSQSPICGLSKPSPYRYPVALI